MLLSETVISCHELLYLIDESRSIIVHISSKSPTHPWKYPHSTQCLKSIHIKSVFSLNVLRFNLMHEVIKQISEENEFFF